MSECERESVGEGVYKREDMNIRGNERECKRESVYVREGIRVCVGDREYG